MQEEPGSHEAALLRELTRVYESFSTRISEARAIIENGIRVNGRRPAVQAAAQELERSMLAARREINTALPTVMNIARGLRAGDEQDCGVVENGVLQTAQQEEDACSVWSDGSVDSVLRGSTRSNSPVDIWMSDARVDGEGNHAIGGFPYERFDDGEDVNRPTGGRESIGDEGEGYRSAAARNGEDRGTIADGADSPEQ